MNKYKLKSKFIPVFDAYSEIIQNLKSFCNGEYETEEKQKEALIALGKARRLRKDVEDIKKEASKEAKALLKRISEKAKEITEPLEGIEKMIEEKAFSFSMKCLELKSFEWEGNEKKISANGTTLYISKKESFQIDDMDQIPKEYFVLDEKKVKLAMEMGLDVPGISKKKELTTRVVVR